MKQTQTGFSLVTAVFLLTALAALGVAMMIFSTSQNQSAALDVMGARAYQAARSGLEWATYQVANSPASSPSPASCSTSFAQNGLGSSTTLAPFSVQVSCTAVSAVEGAATEWLYNITSSAVNAAQPGQADYVERVITLKMVK